MKTNKRNRSAENVLNLEDTVSLTTINGKTLRAHPTYRFSKKEWNTINPKDQRKFLIMKSKYCRLKKKASKKNKNLKIILLSLQLARQEQNRTVRSLKIPLLQKMYIQMI